MACNQFPTEKIQVCELLELEQAAQILLDLYPNGLMWQGKYITTDPLYKFIEAKSNELLGLFNITLLICEDFDPAFSEFLLDRWERLVGLPDDCFEIPDTLEKRRQLVLLKLAGMNLVNEQDYIDFAACFDIELEISYPDDSFGNFPYTFDFRLGVPEEDLFTVCFKITFSDNFTGFPFTFPFLLGIPENADFLICLFNKLKPAHINFKYEVIKPEPPEPLIGQPFLITANNEFLVTANNEFLVTTEEISE